MTWVKDSFDIFIDNIRAKDYVSLVIFDDRSEVLYRPTQIKNYQDKEKFRSTVRGVNPRGSTNIYDGLALGYRQVEANYNEEYINRVILLTDGIHNAGEFRRDDIKDLAARYNQRGITVSAIALGASADIPLMVDLAVLGGGSSRFISDHEKMVETFGSEIDRLLVPAARMVRMRIELPEGVKLKETWGYQHRVSGNTIYYSLDSIHNGDYETLVAEVVSSDPRQVQFGNFYIEYTDMYGKAYDEGPHPFVLPVKEGRTLTNERVIKADGYITLGRGLIDLGNEAKEINDLQREYVPRRETVCTDEPGGIKLTNNSEDLIRMDIIRKTERSQNEARRLLTYLQKIEGQYHGGIYKDEMQLLENYLVSYEDVIRTYTSRE